jgi:hypothetical protein
MKPLELTFALERETKGALRFQANDDDGKPIAIHQGASIGTHPQELAARRH